MATFDQEGNMLLDSPTGLLGALSQYNPGLPYKDEVAGMLSGYAPAGYDWSAPLAATEANQREQFRTWSTTDDPGQSALKILGNVNDPWAAQARLSLTASPGFARSQQFGANLWNQQQKGDGLLSGLSDWGDIIKLAALAGGVTAGGSALFGAGAAGGAAGGAGAYSALGAEDAMLGAGVGAMAPQATGLQALSDFVGGGVVGDIAQSVGSPGGLWGQVMKNISGIPGFGGGGSPLGRAFDIGTGIYGLYQGQQAKKLAGQIMERSDPFAGQRGQYASQLSSLMANPGSIVSSPMYKAGEQAVLRRLAAAGYLGSGNMMTGLADYGGKFFNDQVGQLAALAGAGATPGAGAGAAANVLNSGNAATISALNRIAYGFGR